MKTNKVNFTNKEGQKLSGKLDLPVQGKATAYALFAHCFTCNKNLTAVTNISRALTAHNIGVLRFDFTGLGDSEGEFADTNFSTNLTDLLAAADFMSQLGQAISILVGHSLGGAAVLMAGAQMPDIKAIATIGAPSGPDHVTNLLKGGMNEIEKTGEAEVNVGGRPFKIKKQFLDDLATHANAQNLGLLRKPVLIMHSPQDTIVGIDNAAEIYHHLHHPKSFITLDGADHLLSAKADSNYAGNMIASWAERYIASADRDTLTTDQQVVVRTQAGGFYTEIKAGPHSLQADEPENAGGTNLGPSPYGLLLSALGACTSMTLHMYANRKKWEVGDVLVHLAHSKAYDEDCEDAENEKKYLDKISRSLEFTGELSDEQRKRMLEIADKCPVHKTLSQPVKIVTELKST